MSAYLGYLLAGLGGGAVLAALGTGLVLSHRSSGVLNFAHAAMALYLGSVFFELRETGDLVLPVLGLPARLPLVERPTLLTAATATAVLAAVLGAAVYLLLARPLRRAGPVTRVAGTLGLFLYLQELVRLRFPPSSAGATVRRAVLPDGSVHVLGATVGWNRLLLAAIAIVMGGVLTAVYGATRFGLASRAAADDEDGARLVGRSPAALAAAAWAMAAVLAGAFVVLAEPVIGLGPTTSLLVVPALAAALPGRLRSIPLAVAGGLAIGAAQSLILGWAVTDGGWLPDWVPVTGLQEAVPTAVVIGVLVWRRDSLGSAMSSTDGTAGGTADETAHSAPDAAPFPDPPRHPVVGAAVLAVGTAVALATWSAPFRQGLIVSMLFALICLSVVVSAGWGEQISLLPLAIAGLAGMSALGAAAVGAPFPLAAVVGTASAWLAGRLLAVPLSRLRGVSLAVATLAVAVVLERLVLEGAATALAGREVPRPTILGIDVGISGVGGANFTPAFGFVCLAVLVAAVLGLAALRRSPAGLTLLGASSDEPAARAVGIDVEAVRRNAFTLSCGIAGAAGVLMAYSVEGVSAQSFLVIGSVVAVSLTAISGITRIAGALLAGALAQSGLVVTVTGRWLGTAAAGSTYALLGMVLMVTAVLAPSGLLDVRTARRVGRARPPGREMVGTPVEHRGWRQASRRGVSRVPASLALFPSLTVSEHLALGRISRRRADRSRQVLEWLPELGPLSSRRAGQLSGGEQRLLALARALAGSPRVLLVEQTTTGLSPVAADRAQRALRSAADEWGATVVTLDPSDQPLPGAPDLVDPVVQPGSTGGPLVGDHGGAS